MNQSAKKRPFNCTRVLGSNMTLTPLLTLTFNHHWAKKEPQCMRGSFLPGARVEIAGDGSIFAFRIGAGSRRSGGNEPSTEAAALAEPPVISCAGQTAASIIPM